MHFLGAGLDGIMIAKEPADFDDRSNEETPVKEIVRSKRRSSRLVDQTESSPPSKRQRTESPVWNSADVRFL